MNNGYLGSPSIQTSSANQEIVPIAPDEWTQGYKLKSFDFMNDQDCTIVINNLTNIFLRAGQGFSVSKGSAAIHSFVIKDVGITYNFVAEY